MHVLGAELGLGRTVSLAAFKRTSYKSETQSVIFGKLLLLNESLPSGNKAQNP